MKKSKAYQLTIVGGYVDYKEVERSRRKATKGRNDKRREA